MNKSDLITAVAARTDMKKTAIAEVLDALGVVVTDQLALGEDVPLAGLGKLSVKTRAARSGRNPATGETMDIPAKHVAHFSAAKALKDVLNP